MNRTTTEWWFCERGVILPGHADEIAAYCARENGTGGGR